MKPLAALLIAMAVAFSAPAAADPPDAEAVRKAASAFDDGSRAYRAAKYELAASHFEAADAAVPSAQALRMAIRARTEARQRGRASTLAQLALKRYPNDDKTAGLAKKTVSANRRALHRLEISCTSPCVLALGVRSVPGRPAKKWIIWVPPGDQTIGASFSDGKGSDQQVIAARAGGENKLTFLPKAGAPTPAPTEPKPPSEPDDEPYADAAPDPAPAPDPVPDPAADAGADDEATWIEHPAVFVVTLLLTAGAGGTLIWSGIDTLNNPGTEAVRESCAGLGTDCPAYQQGLDSQLRTNILIGVTGGLGLITAIFGIFVTDWGGDDAPSDVSWSVGPYGTSLSWRGDF